MRITGPSQEPGLLTSNVLQFASLNLSTGDTKGTIMTGT